MNNLNNYKEKNKLSVHYGIRPSGHIHLGNLVTAIYAFKMLENSPKKKEFILTINDWDGDNPNPRKLDFGIPIAYRNEGSLSRKESMDLYCNFLSRTADKLDVKLKVINTSDLLKSEIAKMYISRICELNSEIFQILGIKQEGIPLFPLIKEKRMFATKAYYSGNKIISIFKNSEEEIAKEYVIGSGEPFEMPIEVKLAIKHAILDKEIDLFVVGGNYQLNLLEKSKKISQLLGFKRDYTRAPLVVINSEIMAKSRQNTYSLQTALKYVSEDKLYEILRAIDFSKKNIDAKQIIEMIE